MPSKMLIERVEDLARQHLMKGDVSGWFEVVYDQAQGDMTQVPWASGEPNEWLVRWLAEQTVDPGTRAVVTGCGLGDDAEVLAAFGYEVTALDISKSCIDWCKRRFPGSPAQYRQADLMDMPAELRASFDLVYDSYTVQSLPLRVRRAVLEELLALAAPGARIFLICFARGDGDDVQGPPWPLSRIELEFMEDRGLTLNRFEDFTVEDDSGIRRFIAEYQLPGGRTLPVPPSMGHWDDGAAPTSRP